jgi:DNA-binding IclR family transcriptional regulator
MPKSTTHRLLKELERHQFIDRKGAKYRIGNRFFEMSQVALWSRHADLREIAAPSLERLFEATRTTVHLAVLDRFDVLYLEKITGPQGCRIPSRVGMRVPATCTALGKVMLAYSPVETLKTFLDRPLPRMTPYSITDVSGIMRDIKAVRDSGVSYDYEESRLSVRCVAAPIVAPDGSLAAVSVGAASAQYDPTRDAKRVLQSAREITAALRDYERG